jgi:hypothetical protein
MDMSNKILLKLKRYLNLFKILQILYLSIIIIGILSLVFAADYIYNNYLKTIEYSSKTEEMVETAPNDSADYKNFQEIAEKINKKASIKKTSGVNNIFD